MALKAPALGAWRDTQTHEGKQGGSGTLRSLLAPPPPMPFVAAAWLVCTSLVQPRALRSEAVDTDQLAQVAMCYSVLLHGEKSVSRTFGTSNGVTVRFVRTLTTTTSAVTCTAGQMCAHCQDL